MALLFCFVVRSLGEAPLVLCHILLHFSGFSEVLGNHERSYLIIFLYGFGWFKWTGATILTLVMGRFPTGFYILVYILAMLFFKNTSTSSWFILIVEGFLGDIIDIYACNILSSFCIQQCRLRLRFFIHLSYIINHHRNIFRWCLSNNLNFSFKSLVNFLEAAGGFINN